MKMTWSAMRSIAILPIDVNKNGKIDADERFYDTMNHLMAAISEGKYPSPPARNLYLVTAGKSKNSVVREFLKFVITKGQFLVRIFAWGKDLIGKLYKKNLPRKKSVRAEENKFSSRGKYFFLATPYKEGSQEHSAACDPFLS